MRTTRIHITDTLTVGQSVVLNKNASNHIYRVLRMQSGDRFVLFNGSGGEYDATLEHMDRNHTSAHIDAYRVTNTESPLHISLIQGISRGERMDYTIQKAVELGIQRIVPILNERTSIRLSDDRKRKKHEHWQKIIIAACEQCGRNTLPVVEYPANSLDAALGLDQSDNRFCLRPDSTLRVQQIKTRPDNLCLIVGPEGGFDAGELTLMKSLGIHGLGLGPRILRTETAGIAALSAFGAIWGDL